jgi:hypothetical protein
MLAVAVPFWFRGSTKALPSGIELFEQHATQAQASCCGVNLAGDALGIAGLWLGRRGKPR